MKKKFKYTDVVRHFVFFSLNFHYDFIEKAFASRPKWLQDHIKNKWAMAYDKGGPYGAMNVFYTELDREHQDILAEYIRDNYTGTPLESNGNDDSECGDGDVMRWVGSYKLIKGPGAAKGMYNVIDTDLLRTTKDGGVSFWFGEKTRDRLLDASDEVFMEMCADLINSADIN